MSKNDKKRDRKQREQQRIQNPHHAHTEQSTPILLSTDSMYQGLGDDAWPLAIFADEIFPNEDLGL